jgi:hypothetical protein
MLSLVLFFGADFGECVGISVFSLTGYAAPAKVRPNIVNYFWQFPDIFGRFGAIWASNSRFKPIPFLDHCRNLKTYSVIEKSTGFYICWILNLLQI